MATKEKLLSLLEDRKGTYFSGQDIADRLGVSRAAVWKAVKALKTQGYPIDAVTNKGYCLSPQTDILSSQGISKLLRDSFPEIRVVDSVPSTNSALRDLAIGGSPEGTVLIAAAQTEGRGRMGRGFYSPRDTGIYLSLLLRPTMLSQSQSLQITTMAASAMCLAAEEVTGKTPGIKWVNDLFLNGKKICGILTEAALNLETGTLDYAILGLGLNLYPPAEGFPEDLQTIAGALCENSQQNLKNRITAAFLNRFFDFYRNQKFEEASRIYRDRSLLLGKEVLVGPEKRKAAVLDINSRCQLVLGYEDGTRQTLSYGEVSIVNCI